MESRGGSGEKGLSQSAPASTGDHGHPHRAWRLHWQKVVSIESGNLEALVALRNAIGVVIPIALGVAIGSQIAGVAAGFGALQVSYSDSPGPYRLRARRMLAATTLCSVAVVAGGLAVRSPVLAGILILFWGFCAGLSACLGETFENLAAISLVTLVVYAVQPLSERQALLSGLLAVSGGALQTALALLLWPVHPYGPERRELSALYLELSQSAITPATSDSPPVSRAMISARKILAPLSGDGSLPAERLWSLLNQAERIRLTLLGLRRLRKRLQREDDSSDGFHAVEEYLAITAKVLVDVSHSISRRVPANSGHQLLARLEPLAESVRRQQADQLSLLAIHEDLRFQMDALTGQLRATVRSTNESTPAALQEFAIHDEHRAWQSRFFGNVAKLRANLTLQSSAFRHAVRLTLCLAFGEAVAHLLHHPRSYWLAMTIVITLKQEFAATFNRGMLRILGTIIGLVLATALFHVLPSGIGLEVALIGILVFVLRWAGAANYGIFSIAMSALVVLLLAVTGVPPMKLILPRAEMTILGGIIALATYMVWPTWERSQAPEMLAQLLEAYRRYFDALATVRMQGQPPQETELGPLRMAARLARSNMEASLERLRAEPGRHFDEISLLAALLANSHRFVRAIMALEVVSPESAPPRPEFRRFATDVDTFLHSLSHALRGGASSLRDLPDLREDHHRLVNSVSSEISRYALVNEETDRMTNSLNTLAQQVAHWMKLRLWSQPWPRTSPSDAAHGEVEDSSSGAGDRLGKL